MGITSEATDQDILAPDCSLRLLVRGRFNPCLHIKVKRVYLCWRPLCLSEGPRKLMNLEKVTRVRVGIIKKLFS